MVTISDVDLQKAWLDVYSASGIAAGTGATRTDEEDL